MSPAVSLTELIFTDPRGYGIPATPCQRAWCRILDGIPLGDLWSDSDVRQMLGGREPPEGRPDQFVGTKAPRVGGSLILASWAINRALYCDLSYLYHGQDAIDFARFGKSRDPSENPPILPIISVHIRNARAIVGHVKRLLTRPHWAPALLGKPSSVVVTIRHAATGVPITIEAIAGSASASNLESYWCASVAFDEVFKLKGEKDAVINLDDARVAVRGRILPGGQIAYCGSPWVAAGPAYELLEEFFGEPCQECVAVRTNGPQMNPRQWSWDKIEAWSKSKDQRARDAAELAKGNFISKATGLIVESEVDACMSRKEQVVPYRVGREYVATIDPATRRNAWTLMVAHRENRHLIVDLVAQWIPEYGVRVKALQVLPEISRLVAPYGITEVFTDQWSSDLISEVAGLVKLKVTERRLTHQEGQQCLQSIVDCVKNEAYDLPRDPDLRQDLQQIKRKMVQSGPVLFLASTPDGRHADYVSALALADLLAPGERPTFDIAKAFPAGFMDSDHKPDPLAPEPIERMGVLGEGESLAWLGIWG